MYRFPRVIAAVIHKYYILINMRKYLQNILIIEILHGTNDCTYSISKDVIKMFSSRPLNSCEKSKVVGVLDYFKGQSKRQRYMYPTDG